MGECFTRQQTMGEEGHRGGRMCFLTQDEDKVSRQRERTPRALTWPALRGDGRRRMAAEQEWEEAQEGRQ